MDASKPPALWYLRSVEPFDFAPRTRVVFGAGALSRLGELARELGFRRHAARGRSGPAAERPPGARAGPPRSGRPRGGRVHRLSSTTPTPRWSSAAARPRATPRRRLLRGPGRRQLARLRQGRQLPAHERRPDGRLPGLRQGRAAPAAHDRRPHHRGHGQRGPVLRAHRRTRPPTTRWPAATRAPPSGSPSSTPSSTVTQPRGGHGRRGLRRALPRGRIGGDRRRARRLEPALRPRGLPADRRPPRARARRAGRPGGAGGDAVGRPPRGRGDRGLDAGRHPCLREPAVGPLRHGPRRGHRPPAAPRGALERARGRRVATPICCEAAGREPGPDPAGRLAERLEALAVTRRPAAGPAGGGGGARPTSGRWPTTRPSQWTGRFNPRPFDRAGALELYREAY